MKYGLGNSPGYMVGLENGVSVLLGPDGIMYGVDLTAEVRAYSCDSVLMAEDYVAGGPQGYQPANPGYRTTLQLLDGNNNPRANTAVRIEASDTVTITSGGASTTLAGAGDAMWITTDQSGNLDFVSVAEDIQTPALYIWASFMNQNETIVVYPDHQALTKLANSQASDYQTGKDFDGNSVLPAGVPASAVASTVQNTMGASMAASGVRAVNNPYAAFPASTTNMVYQAVKGSAARTFAVGGAQSFTTTIDESGNVSFSSGLSERFGLRSAQTFGFAEFKRDVAQAGKKIKQFAVKVGDAVEHEITAIDNTIYNFTITCIEDAVTALTGLFKTIFSDIMKAVHFLSSLFDWEAIKKNHELILTRVQNVQTQLRTYLTTDTDKLKTRLHTMFQDWEKDIELNVKQTSSQQTGSNISNSQTGGSDPKQVFGTGGGYAQAKGFQSKVRDNGKGAPAPLIATTLPLTPQAAFQTIQNLFETQIPQALQPIEADLKTAITNLITGFKTIFTDPMAFVKSSFSDLLDLLADIAVLAIQAVDYTFELVITVLADLVDTIFSLLTGSFQIPILSDLFKLIFGRELHLLDLAAWAIAVPVTIVQKLTSASATRRLGGVAQDIFAMISMFTGGLIDAFNDSLNLDPSTPWNWVDFAVGILTAVLALPPDADFTNDAQIAYYALGLIPLILCGASAINATRLNTLPRTEAQQADVDGFNFLAYYGSSACGFLLTLFTVEAAVLKNSAFGATVVKENITANIALMTKYMDFTFRDLTVLSDMVCPTAAMFIGLLST